MKICKYCKKPISDNAIWNPDSEGNGYHHACLCEIEFRLRDKKIYNKGRADVLDKIRERIKLEKLGYPPSAGYYKAIMKVLQIIDKYEAESEVDNGNDKL